MLLRDPDDYITLSTPWGEPEFYPETFRDMPVLQERKILKTIRNREPFTPDWSYIEQRYILLEKTETLIKFAEVHITTNAPYVENFEVHFIWEILTPDPESYQVVFRKQYNLHWLKSKPLVWKTIRKFVFKGIVDYNNQYSTFF